MDQAQSVTDGRYSGGNRKAYSVPELVKEYPISGGFLRSEIRCGALKARRLGRRVLVLKEDWDAYIANAG